MIEEKVRAGRGRRSLIEAVGQQTLSSNKVEAVKKPSSLEEVVKALPPGQHVRMSAEEYRKLLDGK
jgi:hypothetical protein